MNEKYALIVEDALNWAKQHELSLGELGFKTSVANDYAEALGLLRRLSFNVAVIDLCLITNAEPENLNGFFLLNYLYEKSIPVIVVTGHGPRKLVNRIYDDFDVFAVLDKLSFDPQKFKEYIQQATSQKPDVMDDSEKKKSVSREKIEAFIDEIMQVVRSQPGTFGFGLRGNKKVQSKRQQVLISHSAKDKNVAAKLADDLRVKGLEVWYDNDEINVGDTILEKIEQGAKSDCMIIILSPDSLDSWIVKQELVIFLNEENRRGCSLVIPVLYKDCQIPPLLEGRRYADFRESYESGFAELQKILGTPKPITESD
jgi:CheY-like chemotaxis protein